VKERRVVVRQMQGQAGLKLALSAVGLSRSSYYYQARDRQAGKRDYPLDRTLVHILRTLTGYELTLGYRKTRDYLEQTLGTRRYNPKKVYRHKKALGMLQPKRVKRKSMPQRKLAVYSPLFSNVRWEADLSHVFYGKGVAYAFVVIDTYDQELIGSCFGMRARAKEAVEALDEAVRKRFGEMGPPPGFEVALRVDRGCQYTAQEFCAAAEKRPWLKLEFCGVQAPNDKPYIESWFACYKREEVYRNEYRNFWQAKAGFETYLEWYNYRRPHGSLGNLSPTAFRAGHKNSRNRNVSTISACFLSKN